MRTIKFRAWDKEEKKMFFGAGKYMALSVEERQKKYKDLEVMQYTGLKDKNGKEIYEGDIVKEGGFLSVVEWDRFCWVDTLIGKRESEDGRTSVIDGTERYEIIGNIYSNPELLTPKPQ